MAAEHEGATSGVADPEEFNQTTRLRTLNDIRKQAGEAIQATMTQLRTNEGFGIDDRQQILRAAVYRYLTEIEWLAHDADANELLSSAPFGTVTLQPPEYLRELVNSQSPGFPRVVGSPTLSEEEHSIQGINGYLTAPEVFETTWSVTIETRHGGPESVAETRATYMPAHVSLNAFRMANRFLNEHGIDIELADEQHRAVVDDELLEEVEQWRQQNIE